MKTHKKIFIFKNGNQLADFAIKKWRHIARQSIKEKGRFAVALSGGKSPMEFYRKLTHLKGESFWQKTHVFIVDERAVPFDSPESNFRMIHYGLLKYLDIPQDNVHPIITAGRNLANAALQYENDLIVFFKTSSGGFPEFDLMILGIGEDGHTASLFPGTSALDEKKRLALEVSHKMAKNKRITMTLPVINGAANLFFVIRGRNKSKIVKEVLDGSTSLPAAMIRPGHGNLYFLLETSAATKLPPKILGKMIYP